MAPNLAFRMGAAWAAFGPIERLAAAASISHTEAREAQRAKVLGTLLFGAAFVFMLPGARGKLDEMQAEMERRLWGTRSC